MIDKMSVYVPALKRRMSIMNSFFQLMNTSFRNSDLDAELVIIPYIINNEAKFYEMLMSVNGNQPLFSQRTTMEKAGIKDVDKMQVEIKKEMLAPAKKYSKKSYIIVSYLIYIHYIRDITLNLYAMANEKEILKQVLLLAKQHQRVFKEISMAVSEKGIITTRLESEISRNDRYTQELEKLILGEEYGKPSNLPGL